MIYASRGTGIKNSLHTLRSAVDLLLLNDDGSLVKDSEVYRPLGDFWKKLRPGNCWGGDFGDGNHFSHEWGGVK